LLQRFTLEDHDYWLGVERLAYDIWENWHRRDIFELTEPPAG
jgi:hypothetical protein